MSGFDAVDQARAEAGEVWADRGAMPGGIGAASTSQTRTGTMIATGGGPASDGKDAGAFRTIGEVTKALKIAPHVLRYWEEQFPMLRPVKRSGGRRLYRPEDIALLEEIHHLVHSQGYTLRGARQFLESRTSLESQAGKTGVEELPAETSPTSSTLLDGLIALRADLARLLER